MDTIYDESGVAVGATADTPSNGGNTGERIELPGGYALIKCLQEGFEDCYHILAPDGMIEDGPAFHGQHAFAFAAAMQAPVPSISDEELAREIISEVVGLVRTRKRDEEAVAALLAKHRPTTPTTER